MTATTAGGAQGGRTPSLPASVTVLAKGSRAHNYDVPVQTLRRYIATHLQEYGLPGMTLCVADREGFVATVQVGWSDIDRHLPLRPDHLFQIGSISKSFAAICVLRA